MDTDIQPDNNTSAFVPNGFNQPDGRKTTLLHSLGYECQRHFNLCVADEHSLLFCSGTLLHVFDTVTRQVATRPSDGGSCLGFVTKNPVDSHVAVGEKGSGPSITIYNWPSFEIIQKLKNGTAKDYVFLAYSPDGRMLCAQDDTMTLWDWRAGTIIARTASPHTLRVQFSTFIPNYIVSCGEEGVTFWRLTKTYTGMKLLKEVGHFNMLDQCEVLAVYIMPDGQVVSGCSWGNILVWDEGRLVVEACRRSQQPCHNGPIVNFTYNQQIDELFTFGMDGWIKMWHYGRLKSDPLSDALTVVIKPVFEIQVQDDSGPSILSYILKRNDDPSDSVWFAQDRKGGLWQVDVRVSATVTPPERLMSCPAGAVVAVAASPQTLHFASLSANGDLHIYQLTTGKLLALHEFTSGGSTLFWLQLQLASSDEVVAVGFTDGTLKILCVSSDGAIFSVKQESKPHADSISAITVNHSSELLVTGSEDRTVFVYQLQATAKLTPVGFLQLEGPVRCFSWSPIQVNSLLICCESSLNEAQITTEGCSGISYKLTTPLITVSHMKSGGNTIVNLLYAVYSNNNSVYLASSHGLYEYSCESKSILKQISVEEKIQTINILPDGSVWFLGLACGGLKTWVRPLTGGCWEDTKLHDTETGSVMGICLSFDHKYLVDCGMDGNLFVYSVNVDSQLAIPITANESDTSRFTSRTKTKESKEDLSVSLEEARKQSVLREKLAVSKMKKARVQKQLVSLRSRYSQLLKRNAQLPESQRLPRAEFLIDKRLQLYLKNMIETEMKIVKQKLRFEVEKSQLRLKKLKCYFIDCLAAFDIEISAFRKNKSVATFVHRKLGKEFEDAEIVIKSLLQKDNDKIRNNSTELIQKPLVELSPSSALEVDDEEPYLRSVQDIYNKLNIKTKRALERHKLMKMKKEDRKKQWQAFIATQPDQEKNLSSDVAAIDHAMRTIGDYKLKCSDSFKMPDQTKKTSLHKLGQLIEAKREVRYGDLHDNVQHFRTYRQITIVQQNLSQNEILPVKIKDKVKDNHSKSLSLMKLI